MPPSQASRADLHVHSKYSDRPSEWLLRRIGSPESFTEPQAVYDRARARGMDFVTISDHNRIDGALAIAHLPGVFLSSELTTYFPEDGAKLHLLAWGFTEAQFAMADRLRVNIYELRRYLIQENLPHAIAHPMFRVNATLTPDHIEKLMVMFNRFELINGTRDPRAAELVEAVFSTLTPELIHRMADRHNLEPLGPTPWVKSFTGGSDDHGGVYIASAFTQTPHAKSVNEFLDHLRTGDHLPGGRSGTSLRLAHSFYHIAWQYYRSRVLTDAKGKSSLVGELFKKLLEQSDPANLTLRQRAVVWIGHVLPSRRKRSFSPTERLILDEFRKLLRNRRAFIPADEADDDHANPRTAGVISSDQTFQIACDITHQLGYTFVSRLVEHLHEGDLIGSLQSVAALAPMAMSISPYLAAMATQHKDEAFMQAVAQRFDAGKHLNFRSDRIAWATDTFADINGVARTIHAVASAARTVGQPLTVLTSVRDMPEVAFDAHNFAPVGEFKLPAYEQQTLSVPPFLHVIEHIERQRYSQIVISTPGPMGLTVLAAAKLLGLRSVGVYHTDFPSYVRCLTEDPSLEQLTWRFMVWFYSQMDLILAPSEAYRQQLIDAGLESSKIGILRRGVDARLFHPAHRQNDLWKHAGMESSFTFLYVGRVSQEKNLRTLLTQFDTLLSQGHKAQLVIVGEGPILAELRKLKPRGVHFTGVLHGHDLSRAYASADAFVFPSTTDTFGNVILEAQASGLPTIVTNQGGPRELVRHGQDGLIVDLEQPDALTLAMSQLLNDRSLCRRMSLAAREAAAASDWSAVLEQLLSTSPHHAPVSAISTIDENAKNAASRQAWNQRINRDEPAWNIP